MTTVPHADDMEWDIMVQHMKKRHPMQGVAWDHMRKHVPSDTVQRTFRNYHERVHNLDGHAIDHDHKDAE